MKEVKGCKSLTNEHLVHQIDRFVRKTRRFTISNLLDKFAEISRITLHRVVPENSGNHKFRACWSQKQLTDARKAQRIDSNRAFLQRFNSKELIKQIETGDET